MVYPGAVFSAWFPQTFPIRDPVLIFAIVLLLFLVSPMLMARLKLPSMIGLLLAGALLGPHALGLLARDASFVLLGAVGLIYIMFTAAVEIDLSVFRKYGVQGVLFGVLTFSVPQLVGTVVSRYVLGFEWLPAVLLASMFASHTLLAYPIVSRLGLASNQAVTATLAGTIITDTGALLVLAVVAGMATGEVTEAFWWRLGVSLAVYVSAILIGLPRLGRWFFKRMAKDGPAEFVFVLSSVFLCAALSHAAGLEPIVGAFLAGIALNRLIPHNGPLMNRLMFTGEAIFIPFFLLSVGMLLDVRVLFGGFRSWAVAIAMTVTVIATKWLAAELARLLFRYRREEARIVFGLSVVQAAATLAAVMVGHRIGLFDDAVINGTIVMILVTCVLGPSVVARHAPPLAAALQRAAPAVQNARGILIPLIHPDQIEPALELALALKGKAKTCPLFPAFVASDATELERRMAEGEKLLTRAVSQASAADCTVHPIKRVDDNPGRALVRIRKETGARQVVVPWDGQPSAAGGQLGRVVDELRDDRGAHTFLWKAQNPLGTITRVVALFPHGVVQSPLLAAGVPEVRALCKSLGAPLLALCADEDKDALAERLSPQGELRLTLTGFASARLWMGTLAAAVTPSDLIFLLGVRDDEATLDQAFRGYEVAVAQRHPNHDLLVLYPATSSAR